MSRKIIITLSLLTFLVSAYLLMSGSELLVKPLIEKPTLPLGNVITWLGFIAFPVSIWFGLNSLYDPKTRTDRIFRSLAIILVVLGLLWAPISFLLAGNLQNNFGGTGIVFQGSFEAGQIFWWYSYFLAGAPIVLLVVFGLVKLIKKVLSK